MSPVAEPATGAVSVALFDGFVVRSGSTPLDLTPAGRRLVAFLALHRRPHHRPYLAGSLWPEVDDRRALACLRSTLWRIRRSSADLVLAHGDTVALRSHVLVDADTLSDVARAQRRPAADHRPDVPGHRGTDELDELLARLGRELLPGWYDDWVELERERFRQMRLHALEVVAERRCLEGRYGPALDAALQAVGMEPLRETAQMAVVRIHIAEGNVSEAVRAHGRYSVQLREELGVAPPRHMTELIERATSARELAEAGGRRR